MATSVGSDDGNTIQFGGFLSPERAVGNYAAVASFLVNGESLLITVSVTLAAIIEGRVGHPVDWSDYPPLAALGYERIDEMLDARMTASEIPLTAEDADDLLHLDRAWQEQKRGEMGTEAVSGDPTPTA